MSGRVYSLCLMACLLVGLIGTAALADAHARRDEAGMKRASAESASARLQDTTTQLMVAQARIVQLEGQLLTAERDAQSAAEDGRSFDRLLDLCTPPH